MKFPIFFLIYVGNSIISDFFSHYSDFFSQLDTFYNTNNTMYISIIILGGKSIFKNILKIYM